MDKVAAVAESRQVEERGKTRTYIVLKAETIDRYQLREAPDLSPDVHFSDVHLRAPRRRGRRRDRLRVPASGGGGGRGRRRRPLPAAARRRRRMPTAAYRGCATRSARRPIAWGCRCGAARSTWATICSRCLGRRARRCSSWRGVGLAGSRGGARGRGARLHHRRAGGCCTMRGTTRARCITGRRAPWRCGGSTGTIPTRASSRAATRPTRLVGAPPSSPSSRAAPRLCADCIYDAAATDALLALLAPLLAALPPTAAALFAIERRLNFDAGGLTTRARAEERFLSRLGEMGRFEGGARPNLRAAV